MRFLNVASGSKGNATLIYEGDTLIQIDMGARFSEVKRALAFLGKDIKAIQALLVTHEHGDHISSIRYYGGRIPIFATQGTLRGDFHLVAPFLPFRIADFKIVAFPVYHDVVNPVGYLIEGKKERLGYVTDTGKLDKEALSLLKDCDFYYFESNHDRQMLEDSNRPEILKRRIRSLHGHLSNEKSAKYMSKLIGPHTKQIFLAHLSEECNTPEKAVETYVKVLDAKKVDHSSILIEPCWQWKFTEGGLEA